MFSAKVTLKFQDSMTGVTGGLHCIILHTLTTEAPIDTFEELPVPTAEKMLVDIFLNPEFEFLQGSELTRIYQEVFSDFDISRSRLLRYARRRYCEEKIQHLIDRITP